MAERISALDHRPEDFIREVSVEALSFYADDLSGLFIPEDFKVKNNVYAVKRWHINQRLLGKFGRFALSEDSEDKLVEVEEVMLMGSTIGLDRLSRSTDNFLSLDHYQLELAVPDVVRARGLQDRVGLSSALDFGITSIGLDDEGVPNSLLVFGKSSTYGRADAEGRQLTVDLMAKLLGESVEVINCEPEPDPNERILG